mmetsp:Transcript_40446/g.102812  ORF Transcript_40446/g.102812 Transcript_40446/m.102812 type:complete len:408 (-) Transcript_40446:74-1297(-)
MTTGRAPEGPRWEPATKVADEELKASGAALRSLSCASDLIVTSSSRPVVKVWQVAEASLSEARKLSILEGHGAVGSSCVEVSGPGDRQLVAVCYDDGGIGLWDLRSAGRVGELGASIPQALKAKFLPGGQRLVSGGPSGSLCFWDLRKGDRPEREVGALRSSLSMMKGEDRDPAVKRRRTETKAQHGGGSEGRGALGIDGRNAASPIFSLAVSADGSMLGCGRGSGAVSVMSLASQEWARDVSAHWHSGANLASVRALAFDLDSRSLLSGGDDNHVCLFDAAAWARRRSHNENRTAQPERFSAHRGWVTSLSVCPDPARRVCVTTSWDRTVKLWDFSTHALLHTYKDHTESVFDSAFSPDGGRFFATVGVDAQLVLYVAKHEVSRNGAAAKDEKNAFAQVKVKDREA